MLESYEAYADYTVLMEMVEEMISTLAGEVLGTTLTTAGDSEINCSPPWSRIPLRVPIRERTGVDFDAYSDLEELRRAAADTGVPVEPSWCRAKTTDALLTRHV